MNKKVVLLIMDGWGSGQAGNHNAISTARTPFIDSLHKSWPGARLLTSGQHVGLPEGQMGNSEVGHLNIGAGRIVRQELARINEAIRDNSIESNQTLLKLFAYCVENNKPLHFTGLVSEGGVHSHTSHLVSLCNLAHRQGVKNIYIHAFTDGRDDDPQSGIRHLASLEKHVSETGARIATVVGRYYSMDRDKRWERIKIAYDLLVHGTGQRFGRVAEAMQSAYDGGTTDEFIKPIVLTEDNKAVAVIKDGDAVLCFNFRTDRCRQITTALTQQDMPARHMTALKIRYATMTRYDDSYKDIPVVFENSHLANTLGEVIAKANGKQLRISETEKYPHVTFFFSGGREEPFEGEKRVMIPSPKVATYDLKPAMSAVEVKNATLAELKLGAADFICINFANADMVGHTGVFDAAVAAVETVDLCVNEIVKTGLANAYCFLITADHGNAEHMVNDDRSPNTAHTTNPVPCFYVDAKNPNAQIRNGLLCDLAPTVLSLMGIPIPGEMTGKTLLKS